MKFNFHLYGFIILIILSNNLISQVDTTFDASTLYDESQVELKAPSWDQIDSYKSNPDFIYERAPKQRFRWLNRFLRWFGNLFDFDINDNSAKNVGGFFNIIGQIIKWLFIASLVALILYAILRILDVDINSLFKKSPNKTYIKYDVFEENIHELSFGDLISEAEGSKQFRLATRLQYLQVLKALTDEEIIAWRPSKTNNDYLSEYSAKHEPAAYKEIIYLYEHIWYGEFPINAEMYNSVKASYAQFVKESKMVTA